MITYKDAKGKKLLLDSCLVTKLKFYKMFSVFNVHLFIFSHLYASHVTIQIMQCVSWNHVWMRYYHSISKRDQLKMIKYD